MAYSLETSSVKTIVPGAEVSGFADVVARQALSAQMSLSAGEGINFVEDAENHRTRIDLGLSAGSNMSFVYDQETNTYRLDAAGGDLSNYYTKTETSSNQELNTALQYISANAGKTYTGVAPIQVNNSTNEISISGESLSAGPGINIFESAGYVVISAEGGGQGAIYNGISPIDVNNTTHQISAKGVSFGVQEPLFFVQDDNQAVIIGCSASTDLTNYYTKTETSSKQEISAALTGYQTKLDSVNNIVYTASLPATPDANTLYLIPEA